MMRSTARLLIPCLSVFILLLIPHAALPWSKTTTQSALALAQYGQASPPEYILFTNSNIDAVQNGPSQAAIFSIDTPWLITHIQNYHYFNYGNPPGAISLRSRDGRRYGPWPAVGESGQGGVPNAYWNCYPNIVLPPGVYMVEDSDGATWSTNAASGYQGITTIKGYPQDD